MLYQKRLTYIIQSIFEYTLRVLKQQIERKANHRQELANEMARVYASKSKSSNFQVMRSVLLH